MHYHILAEGDATTKVQDYKSDSRLISYSHDTGDIIDNVMLSLCTDACQHGEEEIEDVCRLVIRPERLVEVLPPARDKANRAVEVFALDSEPTPANQRSAWPPPTQVCVDCSKYDFSILYPGIFTSKEELNEYEEMYLVLAAIEKPDSSDQRFHKNYPELQESAKTCAACMVFLSALPGPDTFKSDDSRPIILRAEAKDDKGAERSLWYIDVGFPAVDDRHPGRQVTRYGKVDVVAAHGGWTSSVSVFPLFPLLSLSPC